MVEFGPYVFTLDVCEWNRLYHNPQTKFCAVPHRAFHIATRGTIATGDHMFISVNCFIGYT